MWDFAIGDTETTGYSALHCLPSFPLLRRNTRLHNTRPRNRLHRGNGGAVNSIRIPIIRILVRDPFRSVVDVEDAYASQHGRAPTIRFW